MVHRLLLGTLGRIQEDGKPDTAPETRKRCVSGAVNSVTFSIINKVFLNFLRPRPFREKKNGFGGSFTFIVIWTVVS